MDKMLLTVWLYVMYSIIIIITSTYVALIDTTLGHGFALEYVVTPSSVSVI